ncbi:isochorismatase [Microbulbifer sp. A4B17]|uniref:isochorismatase n=1 Tax=Microbulbifer sp. A4B17 TaxID=359370 RepID=UPI000D52B10D|nr:isochorismatase [Microbulbifer sp. A4B17]AWF80416.1 isochorismatase [Microbulbifer sp. A4B17]
MSDSLIEKTEAASEQWKSYFNSGNAAGCASMYEEQAQMTAKPFGVFEGRKDIEVFWQNLINQGFSDITYIGAKIEVVDDISTVLSSSWKMNHAQGIITRELWVLQEDGTMRLRDDQFEAINPSEK